MKGKIVIIKGKFSVTSWDENPWHDLGSKKKISKATVKQTYSGEISGESIVEYTMYYPAENQSTFIGLEYFKGTISGKYGQLVLNHNGKFENGVASSELMSIDGTDELHNLQCKGKFATIMLTPVEY